MFDLNTTRSYETFFAQKEVKRAHGALTTWSGEVNGRAAPGGLASATMEIAVVGGDTRTSTHRQRHVSESEAIALMAEAGLECAAVYGHDYAGVLEQPLDQQRHTKGIFIARSIYREEERR